MRFVDLSHTIESGMVTYPGLPEPEIRDWLTREASHERYAGQAEFQIGRIDMIANTGTYLDTPFHRFPDGGDLADLPLTSVANLPGVLTDGRNLGDLDVRGRAVLIHTGWSQHWRTERYGDASHPFVSKADAELLAERGAALVGIDCVNIDAADDLSRPAHTTLLRAGIPIVEHLTHLDALAGTDFTFFAVPVKVRGMGTFPVRAFAMAR
ncbi:MAG TPA: cyclase family protein [Thermoanaerobaculia bacterium]|nr:cyclase family protein [Thermoanaerobaculia bacterium]